MNAASYYSELTAHYERYSAGTHGWHYGIWEPDVRSHAAALLRSNELLLRALRIDGATRILDVGFGIGGFAVWAASTFGAHVTGITVAGRPRGGRARPGAATGRLASVRVRADGHGRG